MVRFKRSQRPLPSSNSTAGQPANAAPGKAQATKTGMMTQERAPKVKDHDSADYSHKPARTDISETAHEERRDDAPDSDHAGGESAPRRGTKRGPVMERDDDDEPSSSTSVNMNKRRKTWKDWKQEVAASGTTSPNSTKASSSIPRQVTVTEQRDAPAATVTNMARTEVATATPSPHSSSAFETLMNVAALVQPLPEPITQTNPRRGRTPTKKKQAATTCTSPAAATSSMSNPDGVGSDQARWDAMLLANKHNATTTEAAASSSSADVVSNQSRWDTMFDKFVTFKEKHGHCCVPNRYPEDPSLGSWVATQRRYFKSKTLPMPEDRVDKLTTLGMEWFTKDPRKVPWLSRYHDLQKFTTMYGHCDVPHEYEEFPQLGFWVANQRQQYRYMQLGRKSALTSERIELLNSLGFVWKLQGGRRRKPGASNDDASSVASVPAMLAPKPEQSLSSANPIASVQTQSGTANTRPLLLDPHTSRIQERQLDSFAPPANVQKPRTAAQKRKQVVLFGSEKQAKKSLLSRSK